VNYTITTLHYGTVEFVFSAEVPLFSEKRREMCDKFEAKLAEVTKPEGIWNDTSFCTQAEGYQICGTDKDKVEAAIKALTSYIQRFKHVEFYDAKDY
jgi:hypothetical protein